MCDYGKVSGHLVNIQKLITFLYTSNEQVELEVISTILFILALPPSQIKYLGINLTKYVLDLHEEKLQNSDELNQRRAK